MSKWNRPMRRYRLPLMTCLWCSRAIQSGENGWTHSVPMRITDPNWHSATPKLEEALSEDKDHESAD